MKVRIEATPSGNGSRIWLDDHELTQVRSVEIGPIGVDRITVVKVELVSVELSITADVDANGFAITTRGRGL